MPRSTSRTRAARPDRIDGRDRVFAPNAALAPAPSWFPTAALTVKDQGKSMACTGFALSSLVEYLLRRHGREARPAVSAYMLYAMARRHDEFAGTAVAYGSSLRGALKGWFKHGACRQALYPTLNAPTPVPGATALWREDAVTRPMGAYYRLATSRLIDLHAALNEVGVVLASAACHSGWDEGHQAPRLRSRARGFDQLWRIPLRRGEPAPAGHAFLIVGYNDAGFVIQNSWGLDWGSRGLALLRYDDWLAHAMDCWVAQLGVVTQDHRAVARAATLRVDTRSGEVALAGNVQLRRHEIAPFVIRLGNNGRLCDCGDFPTTPADVVALNQVHLTQACERWGKTDQPVDVCVFMHGGLVDEDAGAETGARWIARLYGEQVFPVVVLWDTSLWTSLKHLLDDAVRGVPRPTGASSALGRWWNRRLEGALARPGRALWAQMKQNADAASKPLVGASDLEQPGLLQWLASLRQQSRPIRLHGVAHSAGAVMASGLLRRHVELGGTWESMTWLAPAVSVQRFQTDVVPLLRNGALARIQQFSLSARAEEDDSSAWPYGRSVLHLVNAAFEGEGGELMGLAGHARRALRQVPNTRLHLCPGRLSAVSRHSDFDNDDATLRQVLAFIKQR